MRNKHYILILLLFLMMSDLSVLAQKNEPSTPAIANTPSVTTGNSNNSTQVYFNNNTGVGVTIQETRGDVNLGMGMGTATIGSTHSSSGYSSATTSTTCPLMYVDVEIPFLQSCISSTANVSYCNQGNNNAYNAYVDLELDAALSLDSASATYTLLSANTYRFYLGTVPAGICDAVEIFFTTACDTALLLDEHCIDAHIYPDTTCSSVWSGHLITVDGQYLGNDITFHIGNKGIGMSTTNPVQCIIIDDHLLAQSGGAIILYQGPLTLGANKTTSLNILNIAANHRYKLEIRDAAGTLIASSTALNYVNNPRIYNYHALEFWNGSYLPFEDIACAINSASPTQANISQDPNSNTNNNSNVNNANQTNHSFGDLEDNNIQVHAFPNPFETYTTLKLEGDIAANFSFKLYDLTGKMVQVQYLVEQQEFVVERNNLLSGLYFYQIEANGKMLASGKLVVR